MPERNSPYIPIFLFGILALGYLLGRFHSGKGSINSPISAMESFRSGGVDELIEYISKEYVDPVDADSLRTLAIESVLEKLDPHSQYIPASLFDFSKESIEGNFEGIGVEFQIFRDTIFITSVIKGGPSEKAGLRPGDRIIGVGQQSLVKKNLENDFVLKSLRGKSGTLIQLKLYNPRFHPSLRNTEVQRGKIPYRSVSHAVLPGNTGFLRIHHFSLETPKEVREALNALNKKKIKALVLDLRGNPGGVLESAVQVCDEFIGENKLITYTSGQAHKREEFRAGRAGLYEKGALAVLMDENSASAAEILAGAVQDHDRGKLIGRRSFGKGFVQEQSRFNDGSGMRLTIARYYTPSGRCIQKAYKAGEQDRYHDEAVERMKTGEFFFRDSIHTKGLPVFYTASGRKVFGGGGIIPDLFVPLDTTAFGRLPSRVVGSGIINELAFSRAEAQRATAGGDKTKERQLLFDLLKQNEQQTWKELTSSEPFKSLITGITYPEREKNYLVYYYRSLVAKYLANEEGYYQSEFFVDENIKIAVKNFSLSQK